MRYSLARLLQKHSVLAVVCLSLVAENAFANDESGSLRTFSVKGANLDEANTKLQKLFPKNNLAVEQTSSRLLTRAPQE